MNDTKAQTDFNWYVLYTYPQYERKIYKDLLKKNITCFFPVQKMVKKWSDRRKTLEMPLFPNYIFVQAENSNRFRLLDIQGVSRFITLDSKPVVVPDKEMETIKLMTSSNDLRVEVAIQNGDKVLIEGGPFKGLQGIVFMKKGKRRFGVKISSINQILTMNLDTSCIIKKI